MFTIRFRDKTTTVVDNKDGEALSLLLIQAKKPDYIEVNGNTVRTSEVISVKPGGEDPNPIVDPFRQIDEGKKCRGQFSIQNEINKIIKGEHPKDWAKKIQDTKFRETIRKQLRSQKGVLWCDYRAGECAC